jgi:hypothetical protein
VHKKITKASTYHVLLGTVNAFNSIKNLMGKKTHEKGT